MLMRWRRWTTWIGLLAGLAALALWQGHEYEHERQLARATLSRQAHSVMKAVIGGIRTHRWLGPYFQDQLQGTLDELVQSTDVLAAAVVSLNGEVAAMAGQTEGLDVEPPPKTDKPWRSESWKDDGFYLVDELKLSAADLPPSVSTGGGSGPGFGSHSGSGRGGGQGLGRGLGLGRSMTPEDDNALPSGRFAVILLFDRTDVDIQCRRAWWLRASMVTAGAALLFCVALLWRSTIRLADVRGQTQLLQSEARHLRELGRAAAGLAHETRNPLGLVRGWTQRLADSGLPSEEQQQQARSVVEECDRVSARINQFLAFARPIEPELEPVDPAQLADELVVLLEPDWEAKKLQVRRTPSRSCCTIRADREMFRQALFNLIQNAAEFSPEGEAVEITLRRGDDGTCRIEVADRGPGVPDDAVDLLFTPYFTTRSGGTGLGLAIVRRIATAHGWKAGYSPRSGGGAVFYLDRLHG
ncbi:MAG: hypothetical protein HQ581_03815 [Planctomycetes bacterium]|nr:hypothetical protein [Planctomycetota bacterium]